MFTPGEHKTVQAQTLEYAKAIGWTIVTREEAEQRRGFAPVPLEDRAKGRSLFFNNSLDAKVWEFNPCYAETEGALPGQFRHLHTDIYGMPALVIECKNANRDEAIALSMVGSLVMLQGVADILGGVYDEKWQRIVAKLPGTFLEQLVQEVLSSAPWGHLKELGAAIGLPAKRPEGAKKR